MKLAFHQKLQFSKWKLSVFSITYSTKILACLGNTPSFYISVGILHEFALLPDVYNFLSSQEDEVPLLHEATNVPIWQQINKQD